MYNLHIMHTVDERLKWSARQPSTMEYTLHASNRTYNTHFQCTHKAKANVHCELSE